MESGKFVGDTNLEYPVAIALPAQKKARPFSKKPGIGRIFCSS